MPFYLYLWAFSCGSLHVFVLWAVFYTWFHIIFKTTFEVDFLIHYPNDTTRNREC